MTSNAQEAVIAVIQILADLGWYADGATRVAQVRVPHSGEWCVAGTGGRNATLGGRDRFHKLGTDWYITVGARTTYLYTKDDQNHVTSGESFRTRRDVATIKERLETIQDAVTCHLCGAVVEADALALQTGKDGEPILTHWGCRACLRAGRERLKAAI